MKKGDWVICLDSLLLPSTWAQVENDSVPGQAVIVRYPEGAPIWESPFWQPNHVVKANSEEQAKKVVQDRKQNNFETLIELTREEILEKRR